MGKQEQTSAHLMKKRFKCITSLGYSYYTSRPDPQNCREKGDQITERKNVSHLRKQVAVQSNLKDT
jgi:hypothetical protein